jgi:hypothetical protein
MSKYYNKFPLENEAILGGARRDRCLRTLRGEHVWTKYIKGYKIVNGQYIPQMGEKCQQCGIKKDQDE